MSDDTLTGGSDLGGGSTADTSGTPSAADSGPQTLDSIFAEAEREVNGNEEATPDLSGTAQAPQAAPPIAAQPEPDQTAPAPESPGEPPKERWPDILNNAREKEREAVLQHVVQQYGEPLRVIEALRANPVETLGQLWEELSADPRYAQQMRSLSARNLRSGRQAPAQAEHEEPQPDLDAGNGVLLYSAQQQAKREAWLKNSWQQEMQQSLAPLQ
jgi:hypothetical protein